MHKEVKDSIKNEVISWIKVVLFAVLASVIITRVVIVNAKVPTGSMEDTILIGDRVVAFRLQYLFDTPKRFDIVVFPAPDKKAEHEEVLYVKRIIGLPGDTVKMVNGEVFINDEKEPLDSSFVKDELIGDFGPYIVPEDSYFMLGDNRTDSLDSRFWINKFVPKDDILGKVIFRYFPKLKMY